MNDPTVLAAIIGAIATICGAGLAFIGGVVVVLVGKLPFETYLSRQERQLNNIPDIVQTRWSAEWKFEDGSLYVKDEVTFDKWKKNSAFVGHGLVKHQDRVYRYLIEGEISPNRIVVLVYKAEKYPSQANIGMACMELSTNAERLVGTWSGIAPKTLADGTKIHPLRTGQVIMSKIEDLRPSRG